MKIISYPDKLDFEKRQPIHVFDYKSSQEIVKQQIILNQNVISFLMEGSKEVFFENSTLSIDNSKFLVMKSGHCLMSERLSGTRNYRSLLFFFSNETLLRFIGKLELNKSRTSKYKSVYSFEYDRFIQRFVESLIEISRLSLTTQEKMLEVKLEELMIYLSEIHGTEFLHSLAMTAGNALQKFTHTVESNQLNKLSIKELAFLCDMSVSTFKREFEKRFSESPSKWFQNKRLEYAHYLLKQEHKNSSEIYLEVGYENLSSFIQAYKSKYGVTPKQHHKL